MIVQSIKRLYHFLKKVQLFVLKKRFYSNANNCIKRLSNKDYENDCISVGFLVQVPEIWDKQSLLYDVMSNDPRFKTCLIIIPAYDVLSGTVADYGEELHFFKEYAQNRDYIVTKTNEGWVDISTERFEYIFYQRPYNYYLPHQYRSCEVTKYSKVCYIPYATPELVGTEIYPEDFFINIYMGFMEDAESARNNNERFKRKSHISFYDVGYIPFKKCLELSSKKNNIKSVLWAPRWCYGVPPEGGSHFFEYNDFFMTLATSGENVIVRPHPLMWDNFERQGLLSSENAEILKDKWEKCGLLIDSNKEIEKTFEVSDIMVSDRSSVIPMFFLTGKPIIYCPTPGEYGSLFSTVYPGLYIANDENELNELIVKLLNGDDPLESKRLEIIKEKFLYHKDSIHSIIEEIIKNSSL